MDATSKIRAIQSNVEQVIKGKPGVIESSVVCLLARGHLLIEDVPGVGKTTLAHSLARSLDGSFRRIQFTSDLLPSDILGVSIFHQSKQAFEFKPGPIFANVVLADEINRTTPKTQSSLLEAMNDAQVSVDGRQLALIVTDGCLGLAAALQTVYPRVAHQRCWVHKLRNLLSAVRRRDQAAIKADAQAIYQAGSRREAEAHARAFAQRWRASYPAMVERLLRDLPELLAFFQCPRRRWRKVRTTNPIERCFEEVRRRTRPMVCFVNVQSVERIIFSIFHRFNLEWRQHTRRVFTQAA